MNPGGCRRIHRQGRRGASRDGWVLVTQPVEGEVTKFEVWSEAFESRPVVRW